MSDNERWKRGARARIERDAEALKDRLLGRDPDGKPPGLRPRGGHRRAGRRRLMAAGVVGVIAVAGVVVASRTAQSKAGSPPAGSAGPEPSVESVPVTDGAVGDPITSELESPSTVDAAAPLPPSTASTRLADTQPGNASGGCPSVEVPLAADTDGDGCSEPLRYQDGILSSGSARWSVGEVGDNVATGDWHCRGHAELALVHPATGDVFVFDGWARPGEQLTATAAARIVGAFAPRAAGPGSGSCPTLVVDRTAGPPVEVALEGPGA